MAKNNKVSVFCATCGGVGQADSHESAWRRVRHEGGLHEAEDASWEEAVEKGWADGFSPSAPADNDD